MDEESPQFARYSPGPGTVAVTLLDGPLCGMTVHVPPTLPRLVNVNGMRGGNHTVWVTHTYHRTDAGYLHLRSAVDFIGSSC
jgi:hypothetical protein